MAEGARALGLRIFSAAVLATAALLATFIGGLAFLGLVLVFAGLVHREWFRVPDPARYRSALPLLVGCWAGAVAFQAFDAQTGILVTAAGGLAGAMLAIRAGHSAFMALAGAVYIGAPSLIFLHIRAVGLEPVIFLFVVVWITDTGAFAAGRLIGGPKLWPSVSPKKTWSGAIGGAVTGVGAGVAVAAIGGHPDVSIATVAAVSLVLSVAGQLGDLSESAWKRHFNVKDTGGIIPGHGGVMDRLDSLLFAAPVLAVLLPSGGGAS